MTYRPLGYAMTREAAYVILADVRREGPTDRLRRWVRWRRRWKLLRYVRQTMALWPGRWGTL